METTMQVLIILVSGTLTVFLVAAIVATVLLIQTLRSVKRVGKKAEVIADKAEAIGSYFEQAAGKLALGRLISNILDTVRPSNKQSKKED